MVAGTAKEERIHRHLQVASNLTTAPTTPHQLTSRRSSDNQQISETTTNSNNTHTRTYHRPTQRKPQQKGHESLPTAAHTQNVPRCPLGNSPGEPSHASAYLRSTLSLHHRLHHKTHPHTHTYIHRRQQQDDIRLIVHSSDIPHSVGMDNEHDVTSILQADRFIQELPYRTPRGPRSAARQIPTGLWGYDVVAREW